VQINFKIEPLTKVMARVRFSTDFVIYFMGVQKGNLHISGSIGDKNERLVLILT